MMEVIEKAKEYFLALCDHTPAPLNFTAKIVENNDLELTIWRKLYGGLFEYVETVEVKSMVQGVLLARSENYKMIIDDEYKEMIVRYFFRGAKFSLDHEPEGINKQ